MLYNVEDLKAPPQSCVCVCVVLQLIRTHNRVLKCVRSPSICVTCVQYLRILMDHKGVCAGAGPRGFGAVKHFLFFGTCEFFRLTHANTTPCFADTDYPKIYLFLFPAG